MALVSMLELLDHAAVNGYGIPAFNVNNLEQVTAIMQAADEVNAPVIMQASAGARKYAGEGFLKHLIQAAVESYPHIPVVMHQDHGQSPDTYVGALSMVLMHDDGNVRIAFDRSLDQVLEKTLAGVFARTGAGLHDHRGIDLIGSLHDGADLLQVVDVESRNAVAMGGGMVQQLAHRNECHDRNPQKVERSRKSVACRRLTAPPQMGGNRKATKALILPFAALGTSA